jgi:hypothetical protein
MPYALLASIAAITMWTVWVVRSGRAGRSAQAIPVVTGLVAGGLQLLAMQSFRHAWTAAADTNPAAKASVLADGLGRASALAVGAWSMICVAALLLVVFSLRKPRDLPPARVVP